MKGRRLGSLIALLLSLPGCIVGFKHPLGPVKSGFIEPRLLGSWECTSEDDPKPGTVEIVDFDGKQYYFGSVEEGGRLSHSRAYATRVGGEPFLNLVEIGGKDPTWMFVRYAFPDDSHLVLRFVDPQPFKEVVDSDRRVRKLLEQRLGNPSLFVNVSLKCVRVPAPTT